jgi:hypothetical protein
MWELSFFLKSEKLFSQQKKIHHYHQIKKMMEKTKQT